MQGDYKIRFACMPSTYFYPLSFDIAYHHSVSYYAVTTSNPSSHISSTLEELLPMAIFRLHETADLVAKHDLGKDMWIASHPAHPKHL